MTTNVHDPFLRRPGKYSKKRFVHMEYTFDEIYVSLG